MSKCVSTYNGKDYSSEQELNEDILEKYKEDLNNESDITFSNIASTTELTTSQKTVLSKFQQMKADSEKIQAIRYNRDSKIFNPDTGEFEYPDAKPYTSVSNFINTIKNTEGGLINPIFYTDKYKENYLAKLKKDGKYIQNTSEQEIDEKIESWVKMADAGTDIHSIMEWVINDKADGILTERALDRSFIPQDLFDNIVKTGEQIVHYIKRKKGNNVQFITEATMFDNENKIIGRFDLATVDENGKVDIWDFKVSTKAYSQWDNVKVRAVGLQFATYRALLGANGIDARNAELNIIPIKMEGFNEITGTFTGISFENIARNLASNYTDLGYDRGKFSVIINSIIKPKLPELIFDKLSHIDDINTNMLAIFGSIGDKSVDAFLKSDRIIRLTGDSEYEFAFRDTIPDSKGGFKKGDKQFIKAKNSEDLRLKVEKFLKDEKEYRTTQQPKVLFDIFKSMKTLEQSKIDNDFSEALEDVKRYKTSTKSNIYNEFRPYLTSDWTLIENSDLLNLGIFAFQNISNGTIDFISISASNPSRRLQTNISNSSTILGNKYSDYTITETKKYKNILDGTVGNAQLMEIFIAINEIFNNLPNLRIGNIGVLNDSTGKMYSENINTVKHNFDIICSEYGINNNITNSEISDPFTALENKLYSILSSATRYIDGEYNSELNEKIDSIYKSYSDANTLHSKVSALEEMQQLLKRNFPNSVGSGNFNDPAEKLYARLSKIIADLNNTLVNNSDVLKSIELNFFDLSKTLGIGGALSSNPSEISDPTYKKIIGLIHSTIDKVNKDFTAYKTKSINRTLKLYEDKGMSAASRYTYQLSTSAFQNMLKRNPDGSLDSNFVTKNPYDNNEIMTDAERQYLKEFLLEINSRKGLVNMDGQTENSVVFDSEIMSLMNSGVYFEIPLIRGDIFSKYLNKSLKSAINDELSNQLNFLGVTEDQSYEFKKKSEKNKFAFIDNQFLTSPQSRADMLDKYGASYFETNLEAVESYFVFADIKKKQFDPALKLIKNIRTALNYTADVSGKNIEALNKYIDQYIKIVVFRESGMDVGEEETYKKLNPLFSTVRLMKLGFSANGLVREPVMGLWNMMTRAQTKTFGKNSFGKADCIRAYNMFLKDFHNSFGDGMSLLEGLSMTYRMSMADSASLMSTWNTGNKGLSRLGSIAYLGSTGSDFMNRNVFLMAQMIHDGCMEAHTMKNNELVYDWTKDKRFESFAKNDKNNPNYNEHKSNYTKLFLKFKEEGYYDLSFGDPLPRAYSEGESKSIKAGADSLFGYYDTEDKMLLKGTLAGAFLLQFQTHLSALKERYLKGGGYDNIKGEWIDKYNEKGQRIYFKYEFDETGKNFEVIETTEPTDFPAQEWTGRYTEGMINSVAIYMKHIFDSKLRGKTDELEHKDMRKANTEQLLLNSLMSALWALLFASLITEKEDQKGFVVRNVREGFTGDSVGSVLDAMFNSGSATMETVSEFYDIAGDVFSGGDLGIAGKRTMNQISLIRQTRGVIGYFDN